ncbi:MAG: molybdopterin molybdotransferase [Alteromonadaceae bacterium]|jgi:molybdopterin molybdotransferase
MSVIMVDCCSTPGLLTFEQAMAEMLAVIKPVTETEDVVLAQALGRVLAKNVISPVNVPPHDNSAMDGYAFAFESLKGQDSLLLAGRSMAGDPFQGECLSGQCIRIMTGAKMPIGCDTVEMQENCDAKDNNVRFLAPRKIGDNVRNAGEDIAKGHDVFDQGRVISAIDLGILASLGIAKVEVMRQLTVALISTGDELKPPGSSLSEGDIYESNSFALAGILEKMNIKVINFGVIADDQQLITTAFEQADQQADAVISSGGVSVGDADYTKMVLEQLGDISFWKIAMKPGKPFAFGQLPNSVFFGLPGNPVSAMVTAHVLAIPALLKMQNCKNKETVTLKVKTKTQLKKSPGRMDFQRGVLSADDQGNMIVQSTGSQGSGILTSLATANCYIILPSSQGTVEAGEWVKVQLFDHYIA